jgi:hypothetical protein
MVDKDIDVIYRPWEEKDENLRYKEERKKAEKEAEKLEKLSQKAEGAEDDIIEDAADEEGKEEAVETTEE